MAGKMLIFRGMRPFYISVWTKVKSAQQLYFFNNKIKTHIYFYYENKQGSVLHRMRNESFRCNRYVTMLTDMSGLQA